MLEVAPGVFQDDAPVAPDAHILVGSCANWTLIADALTQFEA